VKEQGFWVCKSCTFHNEDLSSRSCEICSVAPTRARAVLDGRSDHATADETKKKVSRYTLYSTPFTVHSLQYTLYSTPFLAHPLDYSI
jgi:hypothetical protein